MPLHRRVPKRGFHNPFRVEYDGRESRHARPSGSTPARSSRRSCCASAGWCSGGSRPIKVLARGEVGKALTVRAHKFSGKAAEKIAAAGGTGGGDRVA